MAFPDSITMYNIIDNNTNETIYVAEYESDMLSKKAELEAEGLDVSVKTWEYENPCND